MQARHTTFLAMMVVMAMLAGAGCTMKPTREVSSSGPTLGASPRLVIAQQAASPPAEPYPYFVFCDAERGCLEPGDQTERRHERPNAAHIHANRTGTEQLERSNIGSGTHAVPVYTAHFAFDGATLSEADRAGLKRLAVELVSATRPLPLRVQGYTDDVGGRAYNARLARRRAEAVREYLVAQGLDAATLTLEGFGRCCYVASNQTARGRALNRRAEVFRSPAHARAALSE